MRLTDHFRRAVLTAQPADAEFEAYLFAPFAAELVALMISNLPPVSEYRPLLHPDSIVDHQPTRFALPLNQANDPFWRWVDEFLRSDPLRDAIAMRLDLPIDRMHASTALIRDMPGYKIDIHPDTPRKLATAQVYLANHFHSPEIGVRFHVADGDKFRQTGFCPYLPGSGYFFCRSDYSWHSVAPTTEADGQRDSVMLVYFDSPKSGFG